MGESDQIGWKDARLTVADDCRCCESPDFYEAPDLGNT